jgi:hypothetical protein
MRMWKRTSMPGKPSDSRKRSVWSLYPCDGCGCEGIIALLGVNGMQAHLCQTCWWLFEWDPAFLDILEQRIDRRKEG